MKAQSDQRDASDMIPPTATSVLDAPGAFGAANLIVPMRDVLSRLGLYDAREVGMFFSWLGRQADDLKRKGETEEARAIHGLIIALREYRTATGGDT